MTSMKIKVIIGSLCIVLAVFIIMVISRKSLSTNMEEYQIVNGKIQYDRGIKLLDSDLESAKRELETSYGLGFYKAVAPLGSYYLKKGELNNAEKYLQKAVDSIHLYNQKNQRIIYNELGIVLAKRNNINGAKIFWQKAAILGSKDAKANLK